MGRQPHPLRMAATLTLALLLLGCSRRDPQWSNEGVEPIQLGQRGWVHSLAFSPDSKYLATASGVKYNSNRFAVWDVGSQTGVFSANGPTRVIALSSDGKTMALNGELDPPGTFFPDDKKREGDAPITIWDTTTWKEKKRPVIASFGPVDFLAFHPKDDLLFVVGSEDLKHKVLLLWDLKAGKARYRKELHKLGISALALSPDGSTLVTGGWDCSAKVWEAVSGKELWSFGSHPTIEGANRVSCVAFFPDGGTFATGGDDGKVRLRDLKARKEKAVFSGELNDSYTLAVSNDGKLIVVGGSRRGDAPGLVEFWEVSTGKRLATLKVPHVHVVALSPDGKWLATGTRNKRGLPDAGGAVELWKMADVLRKNRK